MKIRKMMYYSPVGGVSTGMEWSLFLCLWGGNELLKSVNNLFKPFYSINYWLCNDSGLLLFLLVPQHMVCVYYGKIIYILRYSE